MRRAGLAVCGFLARAFGGGAAMPAVETQKGGRGRVGARGGTGEKRGEEGGAQGRKGGREGGA